MYSYSGYRQIIVLKRLIFSRNYSSESSLEAKDRAQWISLHLEGKNSRFSPRLRWHTVYRGSWIKYSSESTGVESTPVWLRKLWYVSGINARSSRANRHLTFMNLSDPLDFYRDAGERLLMAISIAALVV